MAKTPEKQTRTSELSNTQKQDRGDGKQAPPTSAPKPAPKPAPAKKK